MLNLKQANKLLDVCIVMTSVMFGFEVLFYHSAITNWLASVVTDAGVFSWVTLGIVQFLQVVIIPIPATFITLLSMKMYPDSFYLLFFVTLGVILLGVITTYWIGRRWGKKAVVWCAGSEEEYSKWSRVLKSKKTNVAYLATIIFPVFPDDVMCLIAGSIKMNFWWYLTANLIGRAVGLFTFMFVFDSISDGVSSLILMGVLLATSVVCKIIVKRRLCNESCDNRK